MIAPDSLSRGRPVVVLAIVVAAWVGGRFALWEPSQMLAPLSFASAEAAGIPSLYSPASIAEAAFNSMPVEHPATGSLPKTFAGNAEHAAGEKRFASRQSAPFPQVAGGNAAIPGDWGAAAAAPTVGLRWLLAERTPWTNLAAIDLPTGEGIPAARPAPAGATLTAQDTGTPGNAPRRLSADGWVLWRSGGEAAVTPGVPSYGRSQLGGALRYDIAPRSDHAPKLHVRASTAIAGERERDLAAGVSARPVPQVPVRLAVEGRVTETRLGHELRGGVYAVSELPPIELPGEMTGEAYLQAGYVTGDLATPFVDGQARLSRQLAQIDDFQLSAGGGAWGGAQDGAARFDIGPSASVSFPLGEGQARVSADYRFRVAGDAAPDSGPALTLATGF